MPWPEVPRAEGSLGAPPTFGCLRLSRTVLNPIDMSGTDGVGEFSVIELVDGKADGLRHVVRQGCTGRVLAFLWSAYRDVRKRGELARPGVYILVGPNDASLSAPHRTVR